MNKSITWYVLGAMFGILSIISVFTKDGRNLELLMLCFLCGHIGDSKEDK